MAGLANISFGYRGVAGSPSGMPALFSPVSTENLATTEAGSTPSVGAAPATAQPFQLAVRIVLSEDGYVKIGATGGATPTAAVGDLRVSANVETFFAITSGAKIAVRDVA